MLRSYLARRATSMWRTGHSAQLVHIRHRRDSKAPIKSPLHILLPVGYPETVRPDYASYTGWSFVGSMCGSAASVIGTQALFCAAGMDISAPLAASTSWVLKDGIGQLGSVVFSSVVGTRFDTNPKLWICVSAAVLDLSIVLEMIAPMAPSMFLLLASASNGLKNLSFMTASGSRASVHNHLATSNNIADVTVKKASQTTVASMLGMGLGVTITSSIGLDWCTAMALCTAHIGSTYMSVRKIAL